MEQDRPCAEEPNDPRELDCMYKEADRVYYLFARDCGLSTCAYWMLYDVERAGGTVEMRVLSDSWAYSKQTINSAIKAMEAKGLIELGFVEGSRRNKTVSLTEAGEALVGRVEEVTDRLHEVLYRGLSRAEQDEACRLLVAMCGNLRGAVSAGRAGGADPGRGC